uniref:Zinc finger CCCH domain-containing protein 19-like n=1 Tax=Cicer arietinum TaxID=3827 RepID=A0A3Q7YES1_CICAR|nr:zinc finger CCCH domain-containing protein 19-like [Cicer arietinum]
MAEAPSGLNFLKLVSSPQHESQTTQQKAILVNRHYSDECKRLRQSIKCGLINRITVGDIQYKAIALQAVRVKDWLETEIVWLSHLRDRASEKGRRKELRECVEQLQLLETPEERQRRLEEIPEIHVDPFQVILGVEQRIILM